MKKRISIYVLVALATLGVVACNRQVEKLPLSQAASETGLVQIQVTPPEAPELLTKVDGNATQNNNERKVNTLQVFVFRKNGSEPAGNPLETDKYVSGTATTTLNTLTGDKSIWAVVNAPRLYDVRTEKTLMEKVSYLTENRADNLVMCGQGYTRVAQYNASTSGNVGSITPVDLTVSRLCARISLHTVAADFRGTSLEGATLTLLEAYVINVPGSIRLDGTPLSASALNSGASWYNFRKLGTSADEQSLNDTNKILKESGLSMSVNTSDPLVGTAVDKHFYVYPNVSTVKSDDESPSARMTRLILHTYIGATVDGRDGRDSYYSFNIPVYGSGKTLEGNHIYDISKITITSEGSPVPPPFADMEYGKLNASITIGEWGGTETLLYEL